MVQSVSNNESHDICTRVGRTVWFSVLMTDGRYKIFQTCDKKTAVYRRKENHLQH